MGPEEMNKCDTACARNYGDYIKERIKKLFTYHPPKGTQVVRYEALRTTAEVLALQINNMCPDSEQKRIAIQKLEEAIMWANKSIAVNE